MGSPEVVNAQELDRCVKRITRESVWFCSQMPLLAAAPWDDTRTADMAYDYLVNGII